jgi:hypothetical protein
MAEVVDLRGREPAPIREPVLVDPSGRRARLLARTGRAVAVVFLLWLVGLVLAGLGILPAGQVPLGPVISSGGSPPRLVRLPAARQPTRADLAPARSAVPGQAPVHAVAPRVARSPIPAPRVTAAPRRVSRPASPTRGRTHHRSAGKPTTVTAPAAAPTTTTASSIPPGQTVKQTAPGHTKTTSPGRSTTAPGQVKQTTTPVVTTTVSPGKSGSAPGQTVPHGSGHGNSN